MVFHVIFVLMFFLLSVAGTPQFVKYAKRTIMRTGWVETDVDNFFILAVWE